MHSATACHSPVMVKVARGNSQYATPERAAGPASKTSTVVNKGSCKRIPDRCVDRSARLLNLISIKDACAGYKV